MLFRDIKIIEGSLNSKGDLFGTLMKDLFYVLGYDSFKFNIHKAGREIDIQANHRTEAKFAIVECKAHAEPIGGADINKFVGVLDVEKRKVKKLKEYENFDCIGYFVSLSGFKATAIEQEYDIDNSRVILIKPEKIIQELINGRIIVPIEKAIESSSKFLKELTLVENVDLLATAKGWIWVLYLSNNNGQSITHYTFIHAKGEPLVKYIADEIVKQWNDIDKNIRELTYHTIEKESYLDIKILNAKKEYFRYLENECGSIHFEGLPADKDTGSVKVKLENIFVPLYLTNKVYEGDKIKKSSEFSIGQILKVENKLAILAKPGSGKSTLLKRIAIAYSSTERRNEIDDDLPDYDWLPVFIRCRELGDNVTLSITEIIGNIPNRAEISHCKEGFDELISRSLQEGKVLLLIDGLDEIADEKKRANFVNQLRTFLASYPKLNIIITSREPGFRAVSRIIEDYCKQYVIDNLSDDEIINLCAKWHKVIIDDSLNTIKEAEALSDLILNDSRIEVLARNPLLLTTLLFVKRWIGYLPTKRSALYQEMIKLLLVTWNVEGHEQMDIDETEPQLAFVAFWMTNNGKQTIIEEDLKQCLYEARKLMPEILGYTNISVPSFIKRVESRSSILIMVGHQTTPSGHLSQVYEFLHLSFQEYLTAKAIVERYVPSEYQKMDLDEILKSKIKFDTWKEIIPIVNVLSKNTAKEFVAYLTNEIQIEIDNNISPSDGEMNLTNILGLCLANEVQISPNLLEGALKCFAKHRSEYEGDSNVEIIAKSKYGSNLLNVVLDIYADRVDVKTIDMGAMIAEIYMYRVENLSIEEVLSKIDLDIKSQDMKNVYSAVLGFMQFNFEFLNSQNEDFLKRYSSFFLSIVSSLLKLLKEFPEDKHLFYSICWCCAWATRTGTLDDKWRYDFTILLLNSKIVYIDKEMDRFRSWALSELILPNMLKLEDLVVVGIDNLKMDIEEKKNEYSQIAALFACLSAGIVFEKSKIYEVFRSEDLLDIKSKSYQSFISEFDITENLD